MHVRTQINTYSADGHADRMDEDLGIETGQGLKQDTVILNVGTESGNLQIMVEADALLEAINRVRQHPK